MTDMNSANQAFLNECRELLDEMETSLLQLESDPGDADLVNAIFRAAHTIKGTSGVFGFDAVEEFTHAVENVLDRVRDGELGVDRDLTALLLSCRDHIGILVDLVVAGEETGDELVRDGRALQASLQHYLDDESGGVSGEIAVCDEVRDNPVEAEPGRAVESDCYHISVRFDEGVLRHGMDPLSFLRYLTRLGDIVHVVSVLDALPGIEQADAEACYLGYEVQFSSRADKAEIEDVFEFVRDDCVLHILPPRSSVSRYRSLIDALPEEDARLGEMLVSCGALTQMELDEALDLQTAALAAEGESRASSLGDVVVDNAMAHREVVEAAASKQQRVRSAVGQADRTLRVDAQKLDYLVNLVGELVIAGAGAGLSAQRVGDEELMESVSVMSRLVEEIRDNALRLRMVQIGETFNRFQRVVRDVSSELGKDIVLEVQGGDTELDKTVVEKIGDPLMHLVRNAMDHGIESADQRHEAGKPEQGTVTLNAFHDSGSIVIEVGDDGGGLSRERILDKAIERGIVTEGQSLSDQDVYRLVFDAGFSTKESVTSLSGRGVGMDVVKKNIEALRGTVDIESEPGRGSKVLIRLPLTLAIIDGFLVSAGDSSYVIPLDMVFECVELDEVERDDLRDRQYVNLRGEVLPLVRLREFFDLGTGAGLRENIVVVRFGNTKAGLVVDELQGEFQTVIKPLGRIFRRLNGVSGSTILGSGEVAVILDVPGLLQQVSTDTAVAHAATQTQTAPAVLH